MMHLIALFVTVAVMVMFLGSRQRSDNDRYGLASAALLVILAVTLACFTRGTVFFPASALAFAILVLAHRVIVVRFSTPPDEENQSPTTIVRKEFLRAHETCIASALTAALVSGLRL